MKINIEAVRKLILTNFAGKLTLFAKEIDVDYSYINSIMNGHKPAGSKKICDGLISYCKREKLDYNEYIFFT